MEPLLAKGSMAVPRPAGISRSSRTSPSGSLTSKRRSGGGSPSLHTLENQPGFVFELAFGHHGVGSPEEGAAGRASARAGGACRLLAGQPSPEAQGSG